MLDPAALEQLAIETFARVRDGRHLAQRGARGLDFEIVPEKAYVERYGVFLTVRLILWEGSAIQDVKEQELALIPAGADDERIPAYLEGLARGIARFLESKPDWDAFMPHDFVPFHAFRDPALRTVDDFAALVGTPDPADTMPVVFDLEGTAPIAQNVDLERAIDEDPDRVESFKVYADWLSEQGDPRGEMIACSVPDAPPAGKRRAADLLRLHRRYFLGSMPETERTAEFIEWSWQSGYFDEVRLSVDYDLSKEIPGFVAKSLALIMGLPASRFLRGLTIGCIDHESSCDFDTLYPILVGAGPRPSLRQLFIGDTDSEQRELSWTSAGDLSVFDGFYPNLRKLRIRAGSMQLGALAYPKLETLVIESTGLEIENVRAIAAASLPALRDLEVWTGARDREGTATVDDLAPILAGDRYPALERLAVKNCEFTDELVAALVHAPILPRLKELDVSMGTLSDTGAQAILAAKAHFAHLTSLDVSMSYVSGDALRELTSIGFKIESLGQFPDTGERYILVGE